MKRWLMVDVLWLMVVMLTGCCASSSTEKTEVETKSRELTVVVPPMVDTLEAQIDTLVAKVDSSERFEGEEVIHGEKVDNADTTISVKYFPQKKKFTLKVKPPDVQVTKIDTTKVIHKTEVVKSPGFFEKEFWYIAGFLFLLIIFVIILKIKI